MTIMPPRRQRARRAQGQPLRPSDSQVDGPSPERSLEELLIMMRSVARGGVGRGIDWDTEWGDQSEED
jgi:hypothetical protein